MIREEQGRRASKGREDLLESAPPGKLLNFVQNA